MVGHNKSAFVAAAALHTRAGHLGAAAKCARSARSPFFGAAPAPRRSAARVHVARRASSPTCNMPGNIEDIPVEPIPPLPLELPAYWARAGVYGVYATDGTLQYVSAVRDVRVAIDGHRAAVGDEARVAMVRMMTVDDVDQAPLAEVAENWVMTMAQLGLLPPGNGDGAPEWRVPPAERPVLDVRFGSSGLGPESEIKDILRKHEVVLFMKGTRERPRCGFSKQVVDVLERTAADGFVCVDCLDEAKNPGLRQGIKDFSNWPTIPQLYVNGDFVGGADIVVEMEANGELAATLAG